MNPNIPLEIFLPPEEQWGHIHLLVTNEHHGLNNGVFFLRTHEWSVWLMNACLNTQTHQPNLYLEFGDQSALQYWLDQESYRNHTIHVPQRWFNAYAGNRGAKDGLFADPLQPPWKFKPNSVKEADLLVHHAGHRSLRAQRMLPWIEAAERRLPSWELELQNTTYPAEIADFWEEGAKNETQVMSEMKKTLVENARKKKIYQQKIAKEKKLAKETKAAEEKKLAGEKGAQNRQPETAKGNTTTPQIE